MSENAIAAFTPSYLDTVERTAAKLAKSGMFPNRTADQLAVIIMQGHELGLGTMQAANGIYVVAGRAALRAELAVSLVLSSGKAEYFRIDESSTTAVTAATKRVGTDKEVRVSWTMEDFKRAGINNPNYQKYPQRMLEARAFMALARQVYPDVLMGLYAKEELEDSEPSALPTATVEAESPLVPEARQIPASTKPIGNIGGVVDAIVSQTKREQKVEQLDKDANRLLSAKRTIGDLALILKRDRIDELIKHHAIPEPKFRKVADWERLAKILEDEKVSTQQQDFMHDDLIELTKGWLPSTTEGFLKPYGTKSIHDLNQTDLNAAVGRARLMATDVPL